MINEPLQSVSLQLIVGMWRERERSAKGISLSYRALGSGSGTRVRSAANKSYRTIASTVVRLRCLEGHHYGVKLTLQFDSFRTY